MPLSPEYKIWRFYGKALQGTTIEIGDGKENDNLFWFDFTTLTLTPKNLVSSENMYQIKKMENELRLEWMDEQEEMRKYKAYIDAEISEARHSTSTGEEWDIDEWGNEYIPDWID